MQLQKIEKRAILGFLYLFAPKFNFQNLIYVIITNMQILKSIFCTWKGWGELIIPAIGAIVIPLLIVWLTWYFGSSRAERIAEKQQNESKLIYLRSLLIYAIKDFLMFRNNIMAKRKYLHNYANLTSEGKKHLFAVVAFYDIYSQFEPQNYAILSEHRHSFIVNILQAKTYILHVYAKLNFFNESLKEGPKNLQGLLATLPDNLMNLQLDIDATIRSMLTVLEDIEFLEKCLKLKLIQLELEDFEKEELKQALEESKLFSIPPAKIVEKTSKQR